MVARAAAGPGACGLRRQQQPGWVETSLPEVLPLGKGDVSKNLHWLQLWGGKGQGQP